MALKRSADSLALVSEVKRNRQELSAYTNKDKALLEVVCINITSHFQLGYFYIYFYIPGSNPYF